MAVKDTSKDRQFYRQAMRINPHELTNECSQQPMQHAKIARQVTLAASRLAALEDTIAREFGRQARVARVRLSKQGDVGRVTDLMVRAEVNQDPHLCKLNEDKAALKQALGEWEALEKASKDRGFMISKLVDLQIAGLLTPTEPRMSTRGARAQTYAEHDGAPPLPPEQKNHPSVTQGYDESREALAAARENSGFELPAPTTRQRESL